MQKMTEKSQFCAPALASCRAEGQFPNRATTVLDAPQEHPQIPAGYMVLGCRGRRLGATQSPFLQQMEALLCFTTHSAPPSPILGEPGLWGGTSLGSG